MKIKLEPIRYSLMKKTFISFFIMCVFIVSIIVCCFYKYSHKFAWRIVSRYVTNCAIDTAIMMNDAPVDKFLKGEEKELYANYLKSIKNISNTFGLKYLYVYVPDKKNDRLVAIMGVKGEDGSTIEDFELGESPKNIHLNNNVMRMFNSSGKKLTIEINNSYGHVISGYSTITDKNSKPIAIVGADIDFEEYDYRLKLSICLISAFLFVIFSIMYLIIVLYVRKTYITPIIKLSDDMKNFVEHGVLKYDAKQKKSNDEFGLINDLYSILASEKKRIDSELSIAKTIQASSLPSIFPPFPDRKEFDIYADMVTAKEVGGDFYDFFFVDNNNFAFLIADVSGKGVPAALFMMETKALLQNNIKSGIPLDITITEVNRKVYENNRKGLFVTVFLSMINLKTGEMTSVNAGHNPPLLKRNGQNFEYYQTESNLVIGAIENFDYIANTDTLQVGDEIILYTDGVTESMNSNKELYGESRLQEILNKNNNINPQEILSCIKEDVEDFAQNAEQNDDITMLIFRYNGNQENDNTI